MRIITSWAGHALPLTGGTLTGDLTMSGADILLGANKLKTTTNYLYEEVTSGLSLKKISDNTRVRLKLSTLEFYTSLQAQASGLIIGAQPSNDAYLLGQAYDNDNALVETDRRQGAADPYFQMTLPMVLKPGSAPGTPVEGHLYYDNTAKILKFRDASAWRDVFSEAGWLTAQAVKLTVNYDDTSPVTVFTAPEGCYVLAVIVEITTAFTLDAGVTGLGDATDPSGHMSSADCIAGTLGWKGKMRTIGGYVDGKTYSSATDIIATLDPTGVTQGVMDVYTIYIKMK